MKIRHFAFKFFDLHNEKKGLTRMQNNYLEIFVTNYGRMISKSIILYSQNHIQNLN